MVISSKAASNNKLKIAPKSAIAFIVTRGDILRVIDSEGGQVADLVAFSKNDLSERLDQSRTRINNWKYRVTTGDRIYSNKDNVMFEIGEDKVGIHDLTFPGCSTFAYERLLKVGKRKGCLENLSDALRHFGYKLSPSDIPSPFSLFMDVEYDLKSNTPKINPAASKAGDYVDMRVEMDCVVAISSCADDVTNCNHGRCKPLEVSIIN
jgi:uncharacterized protein YcgI (DUF1989 family)